MWDRETFLELVRHDPLTFGVALGEQADGLAELLGADASVRGFLVNLQLDDSTGERIVWTIHVLTDVTLVRFAASREGETAGHRFSPDAFSDIEVLTAEVDAAPADTAALHSIRSRVARANLRVGGGYILFSGSEWYDQWQGSVTDLAVEGVAGFFDGLPLLSVS